MNTDQDTWAEPGRHATAPIGGTLAPGGFACDAEQKTRPEVAFHLRQLLRSSFGDGPSSRLLPPRGHSLWLVVGLGLLAAGAGRAQELEPGAYAPSPIGFNILVAADVFNSGDLTFDPALRITDASARIHLGALGYVRTLGVAGRSANVGLVLPYARGHLEGIYLGQRQELYRSGLADPRLRFAVNLCGSPAVGPKEFAAHRGRTILGASLLVSAPLGQYDPVKLINIGMNRWAFKPELGFSQALGRWTLEAAAGAWLFGDNRNFAGGKTRAQDPLGSFQGHVIYTIRPRLWVALSANCYTGGRSSIDGVPNADLQQNSRLGVTVAVPVTRQHSLKFSYSQGAITTVGGDFNSFGIAWQYVWRSAP